MADTPENAGKTNKLVVTPPSRPAAEDRREREAEALRANLRKRREQARAREVPSKD